MLAPLLALLVVFHPESNNAILSPTTIASPSSIHLFLQSSLFLRTADIHWNFVGYFPSAVFTPSNPTRPSISSVFGHQYPQRFSSPTSPSSMIKRSASNAGLDLKVSNLPITQTSRSTSIVDRQRLLNVITPLRGQGKRSQGRTSRSLKVP